MFDRFNDKILINKIQIITLSPINWLNAGLLSWIGTVDCGIEGRLTILFASCRKPSLQSANEIINNDNTIFWK